jgi:hypothetical protein
LGNIEDLDGLFNFSGRAHDCFSWLLTNAKNGKITGSRACVLIGQYELGKSINFINNYEKESQMERYKNLGGDSGVFAFETGADFIKIKFKTSPIIYVYTNMKTGLHHVEAMKQLAERGAGLQTYINQHKTMKFDKVR